jgi:N-acetylneuraminate synthase
MHCVSEYPTPLEHSSLQLLEELAALGCRVGLSDHSGVQWVPIYALAKGIDILEIHLTPDRKFFGPDVSSSLLPEEIRRLVEFNEITERLTSTGLKKEELFLKAERIRQLFRKGVYWRTDMAIGEICCMENLAFLKPMVGIDSINFESILGKKVARNISADTPVTFEDFGNS